MLLLAAGARAQEKPAQDLTSQYRETADKLIDAALADREGYERLAYLCYRIGNRLSGSPALERAIAWSAEQMKAAGLSNVRIIPVKVPHWVRGDESARMVAPLDKPLHMLGLGMSVGTPPEGITAGWWRFPISASSTGWARTKCGAGLCSTTRCTRATGRR